MRVIILSLLALVLAACNGKARSSFVDGCRKGGGTKEICTCTFKYLEDYYGSSALRKMYETDEVSADFPRLLAAGGAYCTGDKLKAALLKGNIDINQQPPAEKPRVQNDGEQMVAEMSSRGDGMPTPSVPVDKNGMPIYYEGKHAEMIIEHARTLQKSEREQFCQPYIDTGALRSIDQERCNGEGRGADAQQSGEGNESSATDTGVDPNVQKIIDSAPDDPSLREQYCQDNSEELKKLPMGYTACLGDAG